MTPEGNGRKNTQNDKTITNTIYMKPDFPIIENLSKYCNVNVPLLEKWIQVFSKHSGSKYG